VGAGGQGADRLAGDGDLHHNDQMVWACPVKRHVVALLEAGFNWGGCIADRGCAQFLSHADYDLYGPRASLLWLGLYRGDHIFQAAPADLSCPGCGVYHL